MAADSLVGIKNLNPNSVLRLYMASNEKVAIRLFAQVWAPRPMMGVDDDNIVRTTVRPNTKRKIILGDVAQAFLRAFGPSDPPKLVGDLGFDEQKWEITAFAFETELSIISRPYWGFGVFTKCFLNEIRMVGKGKIIDRTIYDSLSFLGRNPWEPVWTRRFERNTGMGVTEQAEIWKNSQLRAETVMREILREMISISGGAGGQDFRECAVDLEMARVALDDRNSHAFERAISRVSGLLNIKAHDTWGELNDSDGSEVIDLTGD